MCQEKVLVITVRVYHNLFKVSPEILVLQVPKIDALSFATSVKTLNVLAMCIK